MAEPAANVFPVPQAYDLTDERELMRLVRECKGYLETCKRRHHGTDFNRRDYAVAALNQILRGEIAVKLG